VYPALAETEMKGTAGRSQPRQDTREWQQQVGNLIATE